MAKHVWFNGELRDLADARVSVFDHGLLYGDGVFEGIRCYGGRLFKLRSHLRRLAESGQAIRLPLPYDVDALEAAVRDTVEANGVVDGYVRLCVTRGVGNLGLNPFECNEPTVFIIADAIQLYDAASYREGMSVITASTVRNHPAAISPRVKSLNYLNNILAKIEALNAGVSEAVMLNHVGNVAECTGDNIFAVRRRGEAPVVMTPPLHAGVLEGITRETVIELARERGIAVQEAEITTYDLYTAGEVFLTGTAAEVAPVTRIDGRSIGDGTPGAVTRQLIEAFSELVRADPPED